MIKAYHKCISLENVQTNSRKRLPVRTTEALKTVNEPKRKMTARQNMTVQNVQKLPTVAGRLVLGNLKMLC